MPQDHDNQSSSPGKNVSPGDQHDALTITHTPTTISIVPAGVDVGEITLPRSIGNVTIQGEIGRGGMGVVFHGRDAVLHRAVAVKFLLTVATQEDDPQFNRFFGGARAEAAVKHPNIVTVYEAGQVGGVPYLVMEFIDGPSLHALIRPSRRLPLPVAVKVLWDIAQAVGALHERDIIHRDLKPGNVLFDRTGHLFVTDFGLASLCRRIDDPTEAAGTPAYMAPETFTGRASPQSDVYAMGCMLFELLTGRLPFTGDAKSIREQHSSAPLPVDQLPASTPSSLVDVIERATHKKEVFRYRRAEQFQRALQDGVATHELLREGAERLATLVLTQHEEVSNDSGVTVSETPSTGTYFERLSDLASKKRDTPARIGKSDPSSEQVDPESADQADEPEVPVRRDPIPIESGGSDSGGQEAHSPTERAKQSPTDPTSTIESFGLASSHRNRGGGSPATGNAILAPIRFLTRPIIRRVNRYLEPPEAELFPTKEVRAVAMRRIGYALLKSWRFWLEMLTLSAALALASKYLWMLQDWMRLERYAPTWLLRLVLVLVVGNVLALWFVRRRLPRRVRAALLECGIPVCMKCGYDLRGQTFPRCPECGREFDETLLLQRRESPDGMQSGEPVSSVSATSKVATSDRTPNLIDISLDGYLGRVGLRGVIPTLAFAFVAVVAGVLMIVGGIIVAEKARADGRSSLWVFVFGVSVFGFVTAVYWVTQRRMNSRIRSMLSEVDRHGVSAVAQDVMSYAFRRKGHPTPALLVKELVKQRRLGSTIRVCAKDQVVRIDPIDVPFEPVMLDEADTAFMGLLGTAAVGSGDSDAANESQALRRVRRNLSMKGGWVVAVGFSVGLVASVYGAIRNRQFNWQILIFAVGMASVFLQPAGWFRSMRKQWLLVPRGLVLRKAGGRKGGWKVHLFERDRSVLCVCRHDKRKWRFFVADAEKSESLLTTKQEIDVLLAAWLSPLDAPSPDRLTDLS